MRLALIADIHGNRIALDAVLEDAAEQRVDGYCFLGDLVEGYDPSGVLERITTLPNACFVVGNTETYIISGKGPPDLRLEAVRQHPERLAKFQEAADARAWCKGWLGATGWDDWVLSLPVEHRLVLPNNQALRCAHSTPGYADGPGIGPHISDEELSELIAGCQANIVCVGHTHVSFMREIKGITVINPGPVGSPLAPDLRAMYAILDTDKQGVEIIHRWVEYDHQAVIEAIQKSYYPSARFIIDHQLGRYTVEDMVKALSARRYMLKKN